MKTTLIILMWILIATLVLMIAVPLALLALLAAPRNRQTIIIRRHRWLL